MKINQMLRAVVLLGLLVSLIPVGVVGASMVNAPPPADMFQLPWDQGIAWVAIDGIDNGSRRPLSSSHNYSVGGAIDFAPRKNMIKGEDTSNFWVAAAATGTVVGVSKCHVILDHGNGWVTQYQFLGNIQVGLGQAVDRNQRLGIIADGVRYKFCLGSIDPDIPHLHFMLRPTLIGATFAGWQVNYYSFFSSTTFTKNGVTVGLYKPLMNVFDQPPTPTYTPTATLPSPTATLPTPTGPYSSTTVDRSTINVGETALVTVSLHNVPPEGYTSAEFTCPYDPNMLDVSSITVTDLFGADPAVAINGPQNGSFIVAIAGSHGNKAAISGPAFTFNVTGLLAGQADLECTARVNKGDNVLTELPSIGTVITILGSIPTPTFTTSPAPSTPTLPPSVCDRAEFIADINVPPGTVMLPGENFIKTWRIKNVGSCTWTHSYQLVFYSGDIMSAPTPVAFPVNVEAGQTADLSLNMTAPWTAGSYRGYWMFRNSNGALFGVGPNGNEPWFVDISVSGPTVTPPGPSPTPSPTVIVSPTLPSDNMLTFTNQTYGFQFKYPYLASIVSGGNDNFTRINLPFTSGTNLSEKYLEMIVAENVNPCQSPLATQSILETSETVIINGITFLKQTGGDAGAGNIYQWVAYSTARANYCVSLDFILHSHNPGNYPTPPPVFDYAAETAVFGQMVSTYTWLTPPPTTTPTTPSYGTLAGQVFASKPVTINLYNLDGSNAATITANTDGTFSLTAPTGIYTAVASSSGFLKAQASVTLTDGMTATLTPINLPAGDIDGNNAIDQFDALTIGMNYNAAEPSVADLNNDGIINVLDLEALAGNYRKTGPVLWQ